MRAEEISDYRDFSTGEIRQFPDLIPIVGQVTFSERKRKALGKSVTDFYLREPFKIRNAVSLGTYDWPVPTDWRAHARACRRAARNGAFAGYHATCFTVASIGLVVGVAELVDYLSR